MNVWQPESGEILFFRKPVRFATGAALAVRGMRWFRDTERRDIQGELPGWPEGRQYTARTRGSVSAHGVLKGSLIAVGFAVLGTLAVLGASIGGGGGGGSRSGSRKSHDRADEVEDFPVMWAAPGALARTLPWQLDPGRVNQEKYRTHAIVTDRRLVIVGLPVHKDTGIIEDEVLWEVPLSAIAAVEPRDFKAGEDLKVVFSDGSWCRLDCLDSVLRRQFTLHLEGLLELIPLETLDPALQATVRAHAATRPPDSGPSLITRNECGCYRVAALEPRPSSSSGTHEDVMTMGTDGTELEPWQCHPEDFKW